MNRTKRYLARLVAVLALAAVVVAVIVIVSNFRSEDSKNKTSGNGKAHPAKQQQQKKKQPQRSKAKTYTVQSGDTLTAIAHKTGVPVAELQALNPEIDPQILIAGEVLKLR